MNAFLPRVRAVLDHFDEFLALYSNMTSQQQATVADSAVPADADLLRFMRFAQEIVEGRRGDLHAYLIRRDLGQFLHGLSSLNHDLTRFEFRLDHLPDAKAYDDAMASLSEEVTTLRVDLHAPVAREELLSELGAGMPAPGDARGHAMLAPRLLAVLRLFQNLLGMIATMEFQQREIAENSRSPVDKAIHEQILLVHRTGWKRCDGLNESLVQGDMARFVRELRAVAGDLSTFNFQRDHLDDAAAFAQASDELSGEVQRVAVELATPEAQAALLSQLAIER